MTHDPSPYGVISSTEELGKLVRNHRKHKRMTLEKASGLANLSVRFLSEFERGKETAEVGKVLKALRTMGLEVSVQPRTGRQAVTGRLQSEDSSGAAEGNAG